MKYKVANPLQPLPPTLCDRKVLPKRGFAFYLILAKSHTDINYIYIYYETSYMARRTSLQTTVQNIRILKESGYGKH